MYVCFMHHRTCVHMKQYRRQCIGLVKAFCPKPAKVHWLLYIFSVRLASVDPNSLNWQPESSALPLHLSIYTLCINAHNSTHSLTDQFTHTHTGCVCGKNSVHVHNLHKSCVSKKKNAGVTDPCIYITVLEYNTCDSKSTIYCNMFNTEHRTYCPQSLSSACCH